MEANGGDGRPSADAADGNRYGNVGRIRSAQNDDHLDGHEP